MAVTDKDDLFVSISGPALSMLFYENTRSHDQIGFLLGDLFVYTTKKVTDNDREVEHIKHHINITTVISFPDEPFYDTVGIIDQDKLYMFFNKNRKLVVGWYHFRKNIPLILSSRDKVLHNELSSFFCLRCKINKKENFLCCLLNSIQSEEGGTHKFKHLLLQSISNCYKPVSLNIINLVEDSTKFDGIDYKPAPTHSTSHKDSFAFIFSLVKADMDAKGKEPTEHECRDAIEKAAETFLKKIIPEINRTDVEVSALENELLEIRSKINEERLKKLFELNEKCLKQKNSELLAENSLKPSDQDQSQLLSEKKSFPLTQTKSPVSSNNYLNVSSQNSSPTTLDEKKKNSIEKLKQRDNKRLYE